VCKIKKFLKDYTKHKKYVTIKKEIFRKMGKTNNRGWKALKIHKKLKRRREICQDIANGTTYKQRKEKQMQQEEKSSQN
jgi:hypothetical protein